MKILAIILCVISGIGCASTTQIVPLPTGEISAPNSGMSRIIIYRFSEFVGSAVGYRIILNGKSIGELGPKCFLYWDAEPGFKTLEVRVDAPDQLASGWKQFSSKSNDLIVLRIGLGATFGIQHHQFGSYRVQRKKNSFRS